MSAKGYSKVSGVWKELKPIYARVGGVQKEVAEAWAKVSGTWQQIYDTAASVAVPGAPTGLVVSSVTSTGCTLTWTAPTSDGGSAITIYKIYIAASYAGPWTLKTTSTDASEPITGLTPNTDHIFRVTAVNAIGEGQPSSPISAHTNAVDSPQTPSFYLAAGATPHYEVRVTVTKGSGGTPTHYDVEYRQNGRGGSWTQQSYAYTGSPQVIQCSIGQTNTAYEFRVKARNADGSSAYSGSLYRCSGYYTYQVDGTLSAALDGCSGVYIGFNKNTASVGFCGTTFGSTGVYSLGGYVTERICNNVVSLLGNAPNSSWTRMTIYTDIESPNARTIEASECTYVARPGQYSDWILGVNFIMSAGVSYRCVVQ